IIKEGSTDVNALDFKDVAAPIFSIDPIKFSERSFPLIDREFINPITQEKFNTITEMVDFARYFEFPELNVYISGAEEIKDIQGEYRKYINYSLRNVSGDTFMGVEQSPDGERKVIFTSTYAKYLSSINKLNILNEAIDVKLNDIISFDVNLSDFNTIEIVMQPNGYHNEVFSFSLLTGSSFEVRTFNMADSSSEEIVFMEITFRRVNEGLKLTKYNTHSFSGINSSNKVVGNNGALRVSEINLL